MPVTPPLGISQRRKSCTGACWPGTRKRSVRIILGLQSASAIWALSCWRKAHTRTRNGYSSKALRILEQPAISGGLNTAKVLINLGTLYARQGRYTDAEPLYRRALAIQELILGPDDPKVGRTLNSYAGLLMELHRNDEAKNANNRARRILAAHARANRLDATVSAAELGYVSRREGGVGRSDGSHAAEQLRPK